MLSSAVSTKIEVSMVFLFRSEARERWTDGRGAAAEQLTVLVACIAVICGNN